MTLKALFQHAGHFIIKHIHIQSKNYNIYTLVAQDCDVMSAVYWKQLIKREREINRLNSTSRDQYKLVTRLIIVLDKEQTTGYSYVCSFLVKYWAVLLLQIIQMNHSEGFCGLVPQSTLFLHLLLVFMFKVILFIYIVFFHNQVSTNSHQIPLKKKRDENREKRIIQTETKVQYHGQ